MKKYIYLSLLFVISAVLLKALWHPGFYTSHDGEHNLIRLYRYAKAIDDGHIPPRWVSALYNGYGYPLFNFSYHLPWILGYPIYKLNHSLIWTMKILFFLSFALSGAAMFCYIRWKHKKDWIAFLSSLVYLIAPYRFLNIFVRAATGEAMALVFPPILFWGIDRAFQEKKQKPSASLLIPMGIAGLLLSHALIFALFFSLALGYILLRLLLVERTAHPFAIAKTITKNALVGFGVSAFYLLPASLEKKFTYAGVAGPLKNQLFNHFVTLKQLVYSAWGYGFSMPGTENDAMSFRIGIAQLVIMISAFFFIVYHLYLTFFPQLPFQLATMRKTTDRNSDGFTDRIDLKILSIYVFLFSLSLFLMTEESKSVWKIILNRFPFDFPWRILGVSVFLSAATCASLLSVSKNHIPKFILSGVVAALLFYGNRNNLRVNLYTKLDDDFYKQKLDTTNSYNEYRPLSLANEDYVKQKRPLVQGAEGLKIDKIRLKTHSIGFQKSKSAGIVTIRQLYFPGWQTYSNGSPVETKQSVDGAIEALVPEGDQRVEVTYKGTKIQFWADIISLASILGIIYTTFTENHKPSFSSS